MHGFMKWSSVIFAVGRTSHVDIVATVYTYIQWTQQQHWHPSAHWHPLSAATQLAACYGVLFFAATVEAAAAAAVQLRSVFSFQ